MNRKTVMAFAVACACVLLGPGCASTPKNLELSKEQILQQEDVKKKAPLVFNKGVEEVRQAGLRALTFVGCELKTQQPYFLTGRRPNKFGLFVGSGGETVKLFLYPQAPELTHVWVDTDLSFAGIAGQQSWDDKVTAELKSLLETKAVAHETSKP